MTDIRLPIGLMFSILGLVLSIYGLTTGSDATLYQKSFGLNINLLSGLLMLIFGLIMLWFPLSRKLRKKQ